jgi:hypothetical protein
MSEEHLTTFVGTPPKGDSETGSTSPGRPFPVLHGSDVPWGWGRVLLPGPAPCLAHEER